MLDMPLDEMVDPHMHAFDLKGTPRPMQPLGKLFGWNDRVLRTMAKRMMPSDTVDFFGIRTDLLGDYLPPEFRKDSATSRVGRYVHIQAGWTDKKPLDPVGETRWLDALDDAPTAIVGHADLRLGADVAPVLRAHKSASTRMRGIRHMLAWHPVDGVMNFAGKAGMSRTSAFRDGFDQLAEHGLSFDAWCYSGQLSEVAELAEHNPDVPVVLCHMGTPVGIGGAFAGVGQSAQERARIADRWREGIDEVAAQPHVRCKISGLLMPALGFGYHTEKSNASVAELVDKLGPMVEHCVNAFGPDRCMVASNFPVDRVSLDYETMTRTMLDLTDRYGDDAQRSMFRDTAAAFYRI